MTENYNFDKENIKIKKLYFILGIFELFTFVTLLNVSVFNALLFNFTTEMVNNMFYIINLLLTLALAISYFKMKPSWCGTIYFINALRTVVALTVNAFQGELTFFSTSSLIYIAECLMIAYMLLASEPKNQKTLCSLIMLSVVSGTLISSASTMMKAVEKEELMIIITSAVSELFNVVTNIVIMMILIKIIRFENSKRIPQYENQIEN